MKKLLFINACVRKENSRSLKIAEAYLNKRLAEDDFVFTERNLCEKAISPFVNSTFSKETGTQIYVEPSYAKEFAEADEIVLAAPFWEFMFPAVVSSYFELVSLVGTAFKYTDKGSVGLCKAKSFKYIYTAGDYLKEDDKINEIYLRKLTGLFGIEEFSSIYVDGLDIFGNDAKKLIEDKIKEISK